MILLAVFTILNSLHVISLVSLTISGQSKSIRSVKEDPNKTKNKNPGGGTYKTKEEVEKAPSDDHPCNLTQTSVRITFPELKGELFVNLLGYKEPNIVHLMRCSGQCGNDNSQIACVPTEVNERALNMVVKSHLHGQKSKQRYKFVTLEKHLECGCQCKDVSAAFCAGTFNTQNCECECEGDLMKQRISVCGSRAATYWDYKTCKCKLKKTAHDCIASSEEGRDTLEYRTVDVLCYTFLGSCFTMAVFLACTTWQYRKRLRIMSRNIMVDPQGSQVPDMSGYNNQYDLQVEDGLEKEADMPCIDKCSNSFGL